MLMSEKQPKPQDFEKYDPEKHANYHVESLVVKTEQQDLYDGEMGAG